MGTTSQLMTFLAFGYSIRPAASGQIKWWGQPTHTRIKSLIQCVIKFTLIPMTNIVVQYSTAPIVEVVVVVVM